MIDAVAQAIMHWAVPYNDWDAISEEQRERWRDAAKLAIDALGSQFALMVRKNCV